MSRAHIQTAGFKWVMIFIKIVNLSQVLLPPKLLRLLMLYCRLPGVVKSEKGDFIHEKDQHDEDPKEQ